jgi:hypothetical protein
MFKNKKMNKKQFENYVKKLTEEVLNEEKEVSKSETETFYFNLSSYKPLATSNLQRAELFAKELKKQFRNREFSSDAINVLYKRFPTYMKIIEKNPKLSIS